MLVGKPISETTFHFVLVYSNIVILLWENTNYCFKPIIQTIEVGGRKVMRAGNPYFSGFHLLM